MSEKHIDEVSGVATTGHEWDGIRELDNPMPRWWLWTFYACIVWAIGYAIAYPAIPLINGATPGLLGYSSRAEVVAELADAKAAQGTMLEKIAAVCHCRRLVGVQGQLRAVPWVGCCGLCRLSQPQ